MLQPLAGTTLLVTGGSGFVCSYLLDTVAHLNDDVFTEPCHVISVDNLRTGLPERVQHLAGRQDFRFINHHVSEPLTLDEQVRSMLYLSTSEIYGDPDAAHVPTREDYRRSVSCTGPRACYDESKRLAETLCATYHPSYHLPVRVVRPFNVYGPGQRLDDRRIVPDLISAAPRAETAGAAQ